MKSTQFTERYLFTVFILFLISVAMVVPVGAQTSVNLRSPQPRVTVPLNSTVSTLISNQVTLTGVTNVNLNVSEVSSIPGGGCSAVLSTNLRTSSGPVFITLNTTNVAQGLYTFSFNADGLDTNGVPRTNNLLLILQAGYVWNGTNNAVLGGAGNWSDSTKWLGGGVPGAGDDVVFNDLGGQTNSVVSTATTTNPLVNSVVNVDTTIGSLRFAQTNSSTAFHTLRIDPGRKLMITGTNGFSLHRDYIAPFAGVNAALNVTIIGTNATMVVSNKSANIAELVDGQIAHTLNMAGLYRLEADVNRVGMGDASLWPNYWNFEANGYNGTPNRFTPTIFMARTNIITANYVNPYNLTNADDPTYAISFLNGINQGTTTLVNWNLGITNAFLADSVCFVGANSQGNVQFNPAFATNTQCYAYFRNTNGGRMSMFAISDARGTNAASSTSRAQGLNFAANNGSVDILADRFVIARDRRLTSSDQVYQGWMYIGKGIVDVNDAALGLQDSGGHTNTGPFRGYCQGIMIVSNSAVFKVNGTLDLGYTTETNTMDLTQRDRNRGAILIGPGGTVMANTVRVGGPAKWGGGTAGGTIGENVGNGFTLTGGASLIISNKIGDIDKWLTTFSLSGNSALALHLNGTNTGHYVYATNMTVAAGSTLNIGSVVNLTIPPEGTNVPIFVFRSGGAANFAVTMPSPMRGTILPGADIDANTHTADLNIITNAPKNLIWRGPGSTWSTDSANKVWLDTATGLLTNYVNGDAVTFDDLASAPDTITLSGTLIPDTITVSNGSGNPTFIFSGSGTMPGGSLVKNGSGTIEIDANTSIPVQINQGAFTGTSAGSVGSVVVASGASMDFAGTVSPSGVTCAGTAFIRGNVSGGLLVQASGIVTNYGTVNGPFDTRDGALLVNSTNANLNIGASGSASGTVVSNATFINFGNVGAALVASTMSVNGVFKDMGLGTLYVSTISINGSSLSNNAGAGTFIPGGDGIGTTTIKSPGVGGGNFPGRVQMGTGSTNIFKVNVDGPTNYTILRAAWTDFGPSVGVPTFNGGFLLITNVGTSPLAAGQSFQMFKYEDDSLSIIQFGSTNSYPIMSPTTPGTGLAWDLNNLKPGGIVAVRSVATTPTNVIQTISFTTRTNNAGVTNIFLVSQLQWPSNYIGWHVEQQSSTREIGLTSSNWDPVFQSYGTNFVLLTNQVTSNSVGFFRMVYP